MIVSASRTDLIFLFFGMASRLLGTKETEYNKKQKRKVVFVITHINIQLENAVAEHLKTIAREYGCSLDGYISAVVSGHCANILKRELDAKKVLLDLIATSDPDSTFERPAEIPWDVTTQREAFN